MNYHPNFLNQPNELAASTGEDKELNYMYTEKFIADIPNPYGYVYITTNLVTGKRYCGKHKSSNFEW